MSNRRTYVNAFVSDEPLWYCLAISYREYLETVRWRHRRERFLEQYPHVCERCGMRTMDGDATYCLWKTEYTYSEEGGWEGEDWKEQEVRSRPPKWHVHHRTYERLGRELDEDLELLCSPCHNLEHYPESKAGVYWAERLEMMRKAESEVTRVEIP